MRIVAVNLSARVERGKYRVKSLGAALVEIMKGSKTADASVNFGGRFYLVRPLVEGVGTLQRAGLRFEFRA